MGLLNNTTQRSYYNDGDHGSYQFTSLDDVINQFLIMYVGQDKIIPRIKRTDVAFHAMRALQELSFDTFKSTKAQEIVLPPTLQMILPHDYINYTQISWSDNSGIKHPLYSTNHTSNPFSILQDEDGSYDFSNDTELVTDPDFVRASGFLHPKWGTTKLSSILKKPSSVSKPNSNPIAGVYPAGGRKVTYSGGINITLGKDAGGTVGSLNFSHVPQPIGIGGGNLGYTGRILAVWHKVNVKGMENIDVGATVNVTAADAAETNSDGSTGSKPAGEVIVSVQKNPGSTNYNDFTIGSYTESRNMKAKSDSLKKDGSGRAFLEWGASEAGTAINKSMVVDVKAYDFVYVLITSRVPFNNDDDLGFSAVAVDQSGNQTGNTYTKTAADAYRNLINDITVTNGVSPDVLQHRDSTTKTSTTWEKFKSKTPAENNNDNYEDYTYWPNDGRRYGLEPSHAQINGSFYIDNEGGSIHFSSNLSGKTIILDYISDSLGTDEEMKVHKFAEEAMYKSMLCDIMSTRVGIPEYAIRRYKQDKKASRRTAKLRLSNIKLEDITQIFRNKSKQIKH
jgi:hypothetical protein